MLTKEQVIEVLYLNTTNFKLGSPTIKIDADDFDTVAEQILLLVQSKKELPPQLNKHDVSGRSGQLSCPACENPFPHLHTDGSYSCEDCGNVWAT